MKKNFIFLGTLLFSGLSFAQVGVNTDAPQATLDVVGKPTDTTSLDGVIAPRITGAQLRAKIYTPTQEGALVYVITADTAPAGQTINVTNVGYYYFDGTLWQTVKPSAATNIYNANGTLTSTRTLMLGGFQLNFNGTDRTTYWDIDGRIHQRATNLLSDAAMGFHGGNANLWIQQWPNANSAITASGTSTGLDLATHFTTASAPITLSTSAGGNTTSIERMRITGEGNVGINSNDPTEKFDNNGITRLRNLPTNGTVNAINTTSTGDLSAIQDQTFTATRTVVADANGVLGTVAGLPAAPVNIYNANGILTSNRTLTQGGFTLRVNGTNQSTSFDPNNGLNQTGIAGSKRASIVLTANDNNSDGVSSNMQLYQDPENLAQITTGGDSRGINIGPTQTTLPAYLGFMTSAGGSSVLGTEKMRITGTGNIGMNTSSPTEKLDNNGITRLRTLPLNGTSNAISTTSTGNASAAQDQTFTATRTVVADANGVLGTVIGVPTDIGTSRVIVNVNVPGNQNLKDQFSPPAIAAFTDESIDPYNAWTNNVFTVPVGLGGLYIMVMQNSNQHVATGATPTFSVIALYEKSTDGGTTWNTILRHTVADLAGTVVDNGNTLYWTGFLNAGDKIRLRFNCNTNTDNIVKAGGLSITKLAQ